MDLEGLSVVPKEDLVIPEGYSIDMLVFWNGKQVAVEVDGPSHFLSGHRVHSATGATLLKHRQLHALGWRLAVVKYWEWAEVKSRKAVRREYLLHMLKQAAGHATPTTIFMIIISFFILP